MNWTKNKFATLAERQASIPGALFDLPDYTAPETKLPHIQNLEELEKALAERLVNRNIVLVGDYDADGVMSTGILYKALLFLSRIAESLSGKKASSVDIIVPDRITEGYGFSVVYAEKLHDSTIVLLDNGIVQYEAIQKAKENGNEVYVIDHHEPGETLPDAEIIVNPHAIPGGAYDNYCAAGLTYRLARALFSEPWAVKNIAPDIREEAMKEFLFMASVATVADVVPVVWENRVIIREGMKYIPKHWQEVCYCLIDSKKESLNEGDVAFKIAPAINAVGRLGELNADFVRALMTEEDTSRYSAHMQYKNEERKQKTRDALKKLVIPDPDAKVLVVQDESIPVGIVGIIAGHLADKYSKPAVVFGNETDGLITGSARAPKGTIHLKNILDAVNLKVPGLINRFGGHESAAGVTIRADRLDEFAKAVNELAEYTPVTERAYDFELENYDWFTVYDAIQKYAPYGEGNPAPILHFHATPDKKDITFMGSGKEHIKIKNGIYEAVGFSMAGKANLNNPVFDLYGSLQINEFKGSNRIQMNIEDITQPAASNPPATDFAKMLAGITL